jgi:Clostripain family
MNNWTVMIYMAGDNNLSEDMITAIRGIERATRAAYGNNYKSEVTFVIDYDGQHPMAKTRRYIITKNKTDPARLPTNNVGSIILPTDGEIILTMEKESPSTKEAITNLIKYSYDNFKADNYALILSGHSDAFRGRTLLLDESQTEAMTLAILRDALEKSVAQLPKKKLDILAFDSCVMNTFEVMYEFRKVSDVWIGSQGSIPNFTWDYERISEELIKNDHTVNQFAQTVVDKVQKYNFEYAFGGRSIDISYCHLNEQKLDEVLKKISEFAWLLLKQIIIEDGIEISLPGTGQYSFVLRLLLRAHNLCQTYMYEQCVDMTDFCDCLRIECAKVIIETFALCGISFQSANPEEISAQEMIFIKKQLKGTTLSRAAKIKISSCRKIYDGCVNLINAVNNLEKYGAYSGSDYRYSHGVSLFLPWTHLSLRMLDENYTALEFSKKKGLTWCVFISFYVYLTARNLNISGIFKILGILPPVIMLKSAKDTSQNIQLNSFNKADFLTAIRTFIAEGGFRDNPKHTKGLEDFMYYFARTRNIFTDFEDKDNFH